MASSSEERQGGQDDSTRGRDLAASLCVLCLLIGFALSGLAWDENWRKFMRVLMAFAVYVIVLLSALGAYGLIRGRRARFPFWTFALAGAMAEISSGWLRPTATAKIDLSTALAAAFLIGGVHWLALRAWRPLYERIVRVERARSSA
jgi:uncharacterized membrane protein (Fun14 family)